MMSLLIEVLKYLEYLVATFTTEPSEITVFCLATVATATLGLLAAAIARSEGRGRGMTILIFALVALFLSIAIGLGLDEVRVQGRFPGYESRTPEVMVALAVILVVVYIAPCIFWGTYERIRDNWERFRERY